MFYNADSGLYLTQYRAYDPMSGRWLSRDPMGEISDQADWAISSSLTDALDLSTGPTDSAASTQAGYGSAADYITSSSRFNRKNFTQSASQQNTDPYPSLERLVPKRPFILAGGSNLYPYVDGNPIDHIDLDGEDWRDWRSWARVAYTVITLSKFPEPPPPPPPLKWSRLSEQIFRVDKWNLCQVKLPSGEAAG
jgi:hypothetical protein